MVLALPEFLSWLQPALKQPRTWKTWFRCCAALAAALVLLVDNETLQSMGQAGFFAAIVAVMLPPNWAFTLFVYAAVTLMFGMLIGWGWGCAAMRASLAARSQTLLAQQQQQAQASLVQGVPVASQIQNFIFHGMFLDPRSSAVYGAFLFVGTFLLGILQAYVPKLALLSIFGSIVLDVMCTYGPLFPNSRYKLPNILIIPTCYYMAIAIASIILLFPQSLNHIWINTLRTKYLNPTVDLIVLQSKALSTRPSDRRNWSVLAGLGDGYRRDMVNGAQALLGQITLIDLEISLGQLGPGDLKKVSAELRSLAFRASGLHSFVNFVNRANETDASEEAAVDKELQPAPDRSTFVRRRIREREAQHGHDLDSLVPILEEASLRLRLACEACTKGALDWFEECNSARWTKFLRIKKQTRAQLLERHTKLEALLGELVDALEEFKTVERVKLIKPYHRFFDPETGVLKEEVKMKAAGNELFSARSLFLCFVFTDTMEAFCERLVSVLQVLVSLDQKRRMPRIWLPSGFGKLGRKLLNRRSLDGTVVSPAMGTDHDLTRFPNEDARTGLYLDEDNEGRDEGRDVEEGVQGQNRKEGNGVHVDKKNPDALPPRTTVERFFIKLEAFLCFFKSPEAIFALRYGVVSVALWVPSVCPTTAWFYYHEKGIWALITAQTGLAVYAGDQIEGFIKRILGTILGLLIGMAVWYIGQGRGSGNAYGLVIVTTVFLAPVFLGRIAGPPQDFMIWTMAGVTAVLVVGYSWVNTRLPLLAGSSFGVELGWKRALLVVIGFTACFIVMLFPRPSSSQKLVRKTLSATLGEVGNILASEVEAFLAEEARARQGHMGEITTGDQMLTGTPASSLKEKRIRHIGQRMLDVSARLQGLQPSLKTARYELQLRGKWPFQNYLCLYTAQTKLLASMSLLIMAFAKLDTKWCSILVHRTPFMNPNLLSEVFANIAILSSALSAPHALHSSVPKLRDRVIYHARHSGRQSALLDHHDTRAPLVQVTNDTGGAPDDNTANTHKVNVEFGDGEAGVTRLGFEELSLDTLLDAQLPAHSTAVVALTDIIARIDEIATTVRELCGSTVSEGYHALNSEYLELEENRIGSGIVYNKAGAR